MFDAHSQLPVGTRTHPNSLSRLRALNSLNSGVAGEFDELNRGVVEDAVVGEEGVQEG